MVHLNQQEVYISTTPESGRSNPWKGACSKHCTYISYSRGDLTFWFSKSEEWELNILNYKHKAKMGRFLNSQAHFQIHFPSSCAYTCLKIAPHSWELLRLFHSLLLSDSKGCTQLVWQRVCTRVVQLHPCWKEFQVGLSYSEKLVSCWSFMKKRTVSVCFSQSLTLYFGACGLLCLAHIRYSTYMCELIMTGLWIRNFLSFVSSSAIT